jgi:hypothetical protein
MSHEPESVASADVDVNNVLIDPVLVPTGSTTGPDGRGTVSSCERKLVAVRNDGPKCVLPFARLRWLLVTGAGIKPCTQTDDRTLTLRHAACPQDGGEYGTKDQHTDATEQR